MSLVVHLLIDKYEDGLPLYRQKLRYERIGLSLPVSTLMDQMTWVTDIMRPLWLGAQDAVLGAVVMHVDATDLLVLERDKKTHKRQGKGKKLGFLWRYAGDETMLYLYCSSGHKTGQQPGDIGPEDFLRRRKGLVVADAAGVFDTTFQRPELIECGCNMHARRYFVKALEQGDPRAALPLAAYKRLFDIEEESRDLDAKAKLSARQAKSRPVYSETLDWCRVQRRHGPPSSPLGSAVGYVLNHQEALTRFLEDGRIPIDNGEIERGHIRVALT